MQARFFLLITFCLLLTACSEPIPDTKSNYIGHWKGEQMEMLITADGSFSYERFERGMTTSINAPLKEFVGDDFIVGVLFFTTTFDVSQPPTKVGNSWQIVVDGVTLTRIVD